MEALEAVFHYHDTTKYHPLRSARRRAGLYGSLTQDVACIRR